MDIKWEEHTIGTSTSYSVTLSQKDWKSLATALPAFWVKLATEVSQRYRPGEWDRLYVEAWVDSGRIIGYPFKRGTMRSKSLVHVQVTVQLVFQEYNELSNPEDDPKTFEFRVDSLEARVWQALQRAAHTSEVRKVYRKLKEANDFTIWRQSADDEESAQQFFLVF